jgi:hypothetical protein
MAAWPTSPWDSLNGGHWSLDQGPGFNLSERVCLIQFRLEATRWMTENRSWGGGGAEQDAQWRRHQSPLENPLPVLCPWFSMRIVPATSQWWGDLGYAHLDRRQIAEKGCNAVAARLGDKAIEGVLWCSFVQGEEQCSTMELGWSSLTWWGSSGGSASTWRQRWQGKGGGSVLLADKMIAGGVYIGETPSVLRKDSMTEFICNPFLQSSIFIRIRWKGISLGFGFDPPPIQWLPLPRRLGGGSTHWVSL